MPALWAARSVSRPDEVEMMAMPRPPRTRGRPSFFAYTRRPGLQMWRTPLMVRSRLGPYLRTMVSWEPTSALATVKSQMEPSCLRTLAISPVSLELGMLASSWWAALPLRSRVSMSAIGSVMLMSARLPLPARLGDAGQLAGVGELAHADPAQAELAQDGPWPAAALAAGVAAHLELRGALGLGDQCLLCHLLVLPPGPDRKSV